MVAPPTTDAAAARFASIRRQLEAEEGSRHRAASKVSERRAALDCGGAAASQGTYLTSRMRMQLRMLSKEYPERELEEATCCWDSSRRLGSGRYGAVFKGELRDGPEIAIKVIDLGALVRNGERPEDCGFDREVNMLSKFRHPNLVALLGWAQQGMMHYLVYEFLPGGDLFQRLYKSRLTKNPRAFWWHERLSVCVDTAAGISHMHNSVPKGFHRDIKSANILLDHDGTAKMADFGLSWSADQEPSTGAASAVGTPGYKCPIYAERGRFNEGSEMYSFGMVVLEVLTGLSPSAHSRQKPGSIVFPIAETIAPEKSQAAARCMQNLAAVAHWPQELAREVAMFALAAVECASGDGSLRPCFSEGLRMLRSMADRFPAPGVASGAAVAPSTPRAADAGEEARRRPCNASPVLPIGMRARARSPTLARATSPCSPPEGSGGGMTTPRVSMWPPRTPLGDSHKSVLDPSKPLSTMNASKRLVLDSEASPLPGGRGDEEPCFQLELVCSKSGATGAAARQRLVLVPCPGASDVAPTGAVVKVALVGRHQQPDVFTAWLPSSGERKCISRRAFEIMWVPGDRRSAWLRSSSTNHLLVDGVEAAQQVPVQMRPGSEITFLSEHRTLLCVRLAAVDRQPEAEASPVGMPSPPSRRVLEVSRGGGSPTFCGSPVSFSSPSSPAFQSAQERDMATSATSMTPTRAGLDRHGGSPGAASPMPKALSKFTWEAAEERMKPSDNGGLASKVVLELCGALDMARGRKPRQLGPLQLSARPLLVGPRHQPELFQGLSATLGGAARLPHLLCLAFVGEEHWVLAVVPLVLLRPDSTRVELASDELAVVTPGDRILISCESTTDRSPTSPSSAEDLCLRLLVA